MSIVDKFAQAQKLEGEGEVERALKDLGIKPKTLKKNYTLEEAQLIHQECEECQFTSDGDDEHGECPECGSGNLVNTTDIEEDSCEECDKPFDMWDTYYLFQNGEKYCESCYRELTE